MEHVLANTSKVVMSVSDGNNLMYIPLDRLMENRGSSLRLPADEGLDDEMPNSATRDVPRARTGIREGRMR
jgi:membrane protease subunit HflK